MHRIGTTMRRMHETHAECAVNALCYNAIRVNQQVSTALLPSNVPYATCLACRHFAKPLILLLKTTLARCFHTLAAISVCKGVVSSSEPIATSRYGQLGFVCRLIEKST
ncbi:unnamed protein product [Toxocara canis]|uniref:Tnp_DDE_dom domain-containing protein n=1 Tax=Toxocara canis TaxID=6265 RepID=A0A183UU30_TOXCA|nr:unnamed protein product [Toxocara canis]